MAICMYVLVVLMAYEISINNNTKKSRFYWGRDFSNWFILFSVSFLISVEDIHTSLSWIIKWPMCIWKNRRKKKICKLFVFHSCTNIGLSVHENERFLNNLETFCFSLFIALSALIITKKLVSKRTQKKEEPLIIHRLHR